MRPALIAPFLALSVMVQPALSFDPSRVVRWGEEAAEWAVRNFSSSVAKEVGASTKLVPKFHNTTILGDFGEEATQLIMESRGFTRLDADKKHGIDGIFAKFSDNGDISEVVVTETKTKNTSGAWPPFPPAENPTQMSEAWIKQRLYDEINKRPGILAEDRALLQEVYERFTQGTLELHRELWRHSVPEGKTIRYNLDRDGKIIPGSEAEVKERHLNRLLESKCLEKALPCEPIG